MKSVLDALPDVIMPDAVREADAASIPLVRPDDHDLVRPLAEEELPSATRRGSLMGADTAPLSRHLVWTFGPSHRALPFPLQLRVELSGERVLTVDPEIGWSHQGLERMLEFGTVDEGFGLLARLHPTTPLVPQLLWAHLWETILDVVDEVPARVCWLRVAGLELSRVVAHLDVLRALAEVYADRLAQQIFTDAHKACARALWTLQGEANFCAVGGMRDALDDSALTALEDELQAALVGVGQMHEQQLRNVAFVDGLGGRGVISIRNLLDHGVTGPALRASGVRDDVRRRHPIFAYDALEPALVTQQDSDALSRATQRLQELSDASRMVLQACHEARRADPSLGTLLDVDDKPLPPGRCAVSLEAPNGEMAFFVDVDANGKLRRTRLRTPSFALAQCLPHFLADAHLDDVVPILLGLGMVGTAIDC